MEGSFTPQPSSLSRKTYHIAGIHTTVFGLDELPPPLGSEVACLWLLHPRLQTQEYMAKIATAVIDDWNKKRQKVKGLIAVTFDQRNHGTRQVDPVANEAWKQGNPRHAQDMFSIFRTSLMKIGVWAVHENNTRLSWLLLFPKCHRYCRLTSLRRGDCARCVIVD